MFSGLFAKYWAFDVFEHLGSGDEHSCASAHPDWQDVKTQVDGIFMIIHSHRGYSTSLEKKGDSINFSEGLDKH